MRKLFQILFVSVMACSTAATAHSYWVWTPQTNKWVNPKFAVKDTPKEQMDWAMQFYEKGDFEQALKEFKRLLEHYPNSEFSPSAQYYIGRANEDLGDYYEAFLAYQKTIDVYPFSEMVDEIIERQYRIGNMFLEGEKARIMGLHVLPAYDKAAEIFGKITANQPYGRYADIAQFKVGMAKKRDGFYEEAVLAFKEYMDRYPQSPLYDEAKYEIAVCSYYVSRDPYYDQRFTDQAIEEYKDLIEKTSDLELNKEASDALDRLREKKAQSIFEIAHFYERQGHFGSAAVYYKKVVNEFGETAVAARALEKAEEMGRNADKREESGER